MNKICTSIEQSKKLMELGIDINTADMWWAERYEGRVTENGQYIIAEEPYYYSSLIKPSDINYSQDTIKDIPAWSLTALLSLSNSCDLSKERIEEDGSDDRYWFHDDNFHKFSNEYDNPLDAVFEMVCWVKENNKI